MAHNRPQDTGCDYMPLRSGNHSADPSMRASATPERCLRWRYLAFTVAAIALLMFLSPAWPRYEPSSRPVCAVYPDECARTAPFIFDSVFSFLKQWRNTYAPNGHSIIPASVPPNVPLYHAQSHPAQPHKRAFFAFDAEMSVGIYGSVGISHLSTMITTRPLSLLYLDGQSASLTATGSLDSQIALLRKSVPLHISDEYIYDEDKRAEELCSLADHFSIDGFVRMNAGFEVLLCDWASAGVKAVFSSNITVPGNDHRENDPDLPRDPNRTPPLGYGNEFAKQNSWEWVRSGIWHYGSQISGGGSLLEKRVKLDYCSVVTFYNPELSSLRGEHHSGIRGNQTYQNGWGLRKGHRLLGISEDDAETVQNWVRKITAHRSLDGLRKQIYSETRCSGTDWQALTETITDQHQGRLGEILGFLTQGAQGSLSAEGTVRKIHEISHAIIYPYLEYPSSIGVELPIAKANTISRCASLYTQNLDSETMNDFETLVRDAIQLVTEKLCSWEWELFEWSESHTSDLLNPSPESQKKAQHRASQGISDEIRNFTEATVSLFAWIGWDLWTTCEPGCSWDEFCYIPMWPVIYAPGKHQGGIYGGSTYTEDETYQFWKPKCLNQEDFDKGVGRARDPWHRLPDVPQDRIGIFH